jgi:DNA invertase Pin-like site-specific DNA recombinase
MCRNRKGPYWENGGNDMKVGYVRVSTEGQNTARQEVLMHELEVERVFIDRMSGKDTSRPELKRMMEFVREGDVVIVESISRFARCTRDLLELVELLKAKGVEFVSKKEALDSSTPSGRFVLTIFGAVAQLEREYLLERQREGIAIAKNNGVYAGRRRLERPEFDAVAAAWQRGEITAVTAMRRLNMSKTTFYRRIKEGGGKRE